MYARHVPWGLRILLVLASVLCVETAAHAGDPNTGLIQLPLRWCAIKGSPAAADPGSLGEPDTDNVLWRRHERASDRTWIPGANITFRSAFTNQIMTQTNFPIIDDPKIGPGVEGDILDPGINDTELKQAFAACEKAWDALAAEFKTPLLGPVAVNIREFVAEDGKLSSRGIRGKGYFSVGPGNACANPPTVASATGSVGISDYSFLRGFDADEKILAHELGHVLGLGHGNGLDDNVPPDNVYDSFCDNTEDANAAPHSLMTQGQQASVIITSLQRGTARGLARVNAGAQIDPPAALINGDTISDRRVDPVQDVADAETDIVWVTMIHHTPSQTTLFSHGLFGLIPERPNSQYLVFADLDDNAGTGGAPSTLNLGVPTSFQGAELVTRVTVSRCCGEFPRLVVTPTVWRFQGTGFVELNDPSIHASIGTFISGELEEQSNAVSIEMSDAVRGPAEPVVRIQAFAQNRVGLFDRLPDGPDSSSGVPLNLVPLQFPVCLVSPSPARPGQAVTVEATGLFASQMAKVILGDQMVGVGNTNSTGDVALQFAVPLDATEGPRLVTVGIAGTALTADCTLEVNGPPLPAAADLAVTKSRSPSGDVEAGTNVTYTVIVTDNGPAAATNVTLTDTVPTGTSFVSISAPTGWSCVTPAVGASGPITCTKGVVAAGETARFTVVATVSCNQANGAVIINNATASVGSPTDNNPSNNSGLASLTVLNPIPVVTASVGSGLLPQNNHDLVNVGLAATVNDGACPTPTPLTIQVFSDEDDQTGSDQGHLSPDAKDIGIRTLRLREERLSTGDGRVYLIVVKTTDAAGGTGFATATILVPKSSSPADTAAVRAAAAAAKTFADGNNGTPPAGFFVVGDGPVVGPKQ